MLSDPLLAMFSARQHRFGAARSLLHHAPSTRRWLAMCELLDSIPSQDELLAILPYVEHHLSRWPDALRVAPRAWTQRLYADHPPHTWRIVRALHITPDLHPSQHTLAQLTHTDHLHSLHLLAIHDHHNTLQGTTTLTQLTSQHDLSHLHSLAIHHWSTAPERLAKLLASHPFHSLRRLSITHSRLDDHALHILLNAPWLQNLHTLELPHNILRSPSALAILNAHLPHLSHLNLAHNHIDQHGLFALLQSPQLKLLILRDNLSKMVIPTPCAYDVINPTGGKDCVMCRF